MQYLYLNYGLVYLDGKLTKKNIKINKSKIIELSENPYLKKNNCINCKSQWILPGFIDPHVHFRSPGFEYKEDWLSGSKAALAGGITSVLDMPNTEPSTTTLEELKNKHLIASRYSLIDFAFHFGASINNLDQITKIKEIPSIKIYFGSTTGSLLVNSHKYIQKIFEKTNFTVSFHAEDDLLIQKNKNSLKESDYLNPLIHNKIRNTEVAESAILQILECTKNYNKSIYICHISTKKEHELILQAKNKRKIYCEATPHHLFLTENIAYKIGNLSKVNPPLRKIEDKNYLFKALQKNQIDTIGTDHAPHLIKEKSVNYKNSQAGMPGLETCLSLMLSEMHKKNLNLSQIIKLYSENPAKIFKIKNKSLIKKNYDADLVIIDPYKKFTVQKKHIHSKSGWNPFIGKTLKGQVNKVFIRGQLAYNQGQFYKVKGKKIEFYH